MKRLVMSMRCWLRHQRMVHGVLLVVAALLGWQVANVLLLKMLGLSNTAWPWSVVKVLRYGFVVPVVLAFVGVWVPLIAGHLAFAGGIKRALAWQLLGYWLAMVLLSALGLYGFMLWEGLALAPYPWLIYSQFLQFPPGSVGFNHLLICLSASYSLLLLLVVLTLFSAKTKAQKVFGRAHFASAFAIERAGLYADAGVVLGRAFGQTLRLPGFESALIVAPTGSGKTTAIAVPNLLEWQGSGVFNDLKGELYRLTGAFREQQLHNACYLWAPAAVDKNTAGYNPFFYVSDNPDLRIRDLQLIAETLIPATKLGDGFWYQSSREVFLTLSLYLLETTGGATLGEVHDLSKQADFFQWLDDELTQYQTRFSKPLMQNAQAVLGADVKTQKNILKDFHSRMSLFNDPLVCHATRQNDVDFRQLRRKKISIYIHIPDGDKERLSPILTLFWAQLIQVMGSHEPGPDEPYGVLALMDEFGNMARINKLKDGLSFLRAYQMRCVIIVQYLGQLVSVYGRDDAKGFLNAKVKVAFALNDLDDAQFFSKSLGMKTVKVSSSTVNSGHGDNPGSRSDSVNYRSRALMSPDEILQLPDQQAIILVEAKAPILAKKCYWFREPRYKVLLTV